MSETQENYSTRPRTIFRTIKNEDHPFVMVDRRPVENPNLSWGAKGILSYLLSRPDNWKVRLRDLVNRSPDGVYKIRGYIRELKKAGHIQAIPHRDPQTKRILEYVLEVYELPFTTKPLTNLPQAGLPQAGLPQAGNLTLNDTDLNDTDLNDIKDAASPLSQEELTEIKTAANKKVDALLEQAKKSLEAHNAGTAWRGRELTPDNYLPYGDWWHKRTKLHMYGVKGKQKLDTLWLKEFKIWWEHDLSTAVLDQAYDAEKGWKGAIGKPSELTTKAIALQALALPPEETPAESSEEIKSLQASINWSVI